MYEIALYELARLRGVIRDRVCDVAAWRQTSTSITDPRTGKTCMLKAAWTPSANQENPNVHLIGVSKSPAREMIRGTNTTDTFAKVSVAAICR